MAVPWGEDVLHLVCDFLCWPTILRMSCASRAFHTAAQHSTAVGAEVFWGQAQSTEQDIEGLVPSLVSQRKALTPKARPNLAMLLVDSAILLTTTVRDLCGRLHAEHLVPLECPILVVESDAGVFGAGVAGEGAFSAYEGRDIELDPPAPVTVTLTVAFIPPESKGDRGSSDPRVRCFLVDDLPQNRRKGAKVSVDGVGAVLMECVAAKTESSFTSGAGGAASAVAEASAESPNNASEGQALKGAQQPLRRSARASTVAHSKAASQRSRPDRLAPPATRIPLEDADTVFLIGDHPLVLTRTTAWLQKCLGEEAVILGGISSCALVVGDQVLPGDKACRTSQSGVPVPLVVGVALRGVQAMAVSAKGFEGLGPVFRVDATLDTHGTPQAQNGKLLGDVTVVSEGGAALRTSTAVSIFYDEVANDPVWGNHVFNPGEMYLGIADSPGELLDLRRLPSGDRDDRDDVGGGVEEGYEVAKGTPPVVVTSAYGSTIGLHGEVAPGQCARFMRTTNQLVLADTEVAYQSAKKRIEGDGSTILSSLHFTCCVRPDILELSGQQEQQQEQQPQPGGGGNGDAMLTRVMALHQQEMVAFCKTLNAPATGVFCEGELGPLATLGCGIHAKKSASILQGHTTCAAVLCWNPRSGGSKSRASSVSQG